MRRLFLFLLLLSFAPCMLFGQQDAKLFERTYISTDKQSYVAGERIWCSAFCFDASSDNHALSTYSAVAYVELVADNIIAASGKISLENGRGAGYIDIPPTIPTGNYRMIAFTALNKNETGYDFLENSRVITIFNTLYDTRLPGVTAVEHVALEPVPAGNSGRKSISFANPYKGSVTMSISVSHRDSLPVQLSYGLNEFKLVPSKSRHYEQFVRPEYDGEMIYATVAGPDKDNVNSKNEEITAYISTVGTRNDNYTAFSTSDNGLVFCTYNIYGNKDLVCEIDGVDSDIKAHMEVKSPFVLPENINIPDLLIAPQMRHSLTQRNAAMLDFKAHYSDSLAEFLPRREQPLLAAAEWKRYDLNEYVRFPMVRDVLVEIIPELRARGRGDKVRIEVLAQDSGDGSVMGWKPSLVLLDGVPIFKHKKMMDYDASLLKEVQIWQSSYFFADRTYSGVVNFVTTKGQISYMDFGSNVRIVDFKGVSYPMEFTKPLNSESDIRQTIFWKPLVTVGEGQSVSFDLVLPSYDGAFDVKMEGVCEDGSLFTLHEEL